MSEKRFTLEWEEDDAIFIVEDDDIVYPIRNDTIKKFELQKIVDKLNELSDENGQLKELINLIADACTYTKEHSVKEILRREIGGIDHAAQDSASAWHAYMILSSFFEEHYKEHWDNE